MNTAGPWRSDGRNDFSDNTGFDPKQQHEGVHGLEPPGVVGKAHARQLDKAERQAWTKELERRRSKSLDAPNWLWSSVVELIGRHEVAYLEHCRKYATQMSAA
jgi:uncharacterized protein (DUF2252 family)